MDLYRAVKRRRSIRNYPNEVLSKEKFEKIRQLLETPPVFQEEFSIGSRVIRDGHAFQGSLSGIIADYGKVEAPHYLVLTTGDRPGSYVEIGYRYEFVVLALTAMGIGTCWIGKGFTDDELKGYVDLPPGQSCRALIAFGPVPEKELGIIEEPKRKELDTFLVDDGTSELDEDTIKIIDALRRAPSSINSQPWRVLVREGLLHLYIKSRTFITKKLLTSLSLMNRIDAGIGLSHLEVAGKHFWDETNCKKLDHRRKKGLEYIASLSK